MEKEFNIKYLFGNLLYLLSFAVLFVCCQQKEESVIILTSDAVSIKPTSAECGGNVIAISGSTVNERGVCWSTLTKPTTNDSKTIDSFGMGKFRSKLSNLNTNTTYYIRAYSKTQNNIWYGKEIVFKTLDATIPSIITSSATEITFNSVKCVGIIDFDGGSHITERGVCWNTTASATIDNSKVTLGEGVGEFSTKLSGLKYATKYYVRAYAINSVGIAYGDELVFQTMPILPSVSTISVTKITNSSATCDCNIVSDGGTDIVTSGICWGTTLNPTIENSKMNVNATKGLYKGEITGLSKQTTYYMRAFATNSVGTVYGQDVLFTTLP